MTKSKEITDYFDAKLSDIKPLITLEFDVHLYFSQNQHMMTLFRKDEAPTPEFILKYKSRGLEKVWIHNNDLEAFKRYTKARTQEGAILNTLMSSPAIPQELKKESAAEIAKVLLKTVAQATTVEEQTQVTQKLRKTIRDVLDKTAIHSESAISEILKLCEVDPDLEHAANVATYAVTFAMAFGKIAPDLLADIALAALLHDIGLSQLPISTVSKPWKSLDPDTAKEYTDHVRYSLNLIQEYSHTATDRVKLLIEQHHEKFDGSGYPNGLKGFKVNDISQLISMADIVDSFSSGRWDGQKRTLKDTLQILNTLEKYQTFPEYFNPEVYQAIDYWISETEAGETLTEVVETVGTQAKTVIKSAA